MRDKRRRGKPGRAFWDTGRPADSVGRGQRVKGDRARGAPGKRLGEEPGTEEQPKF